MAGPAHGDPFLRAYGMGRRIGRGTFGAVHVGHHVASQHTVALKFIEVDSLEGEVPLEVQTLRLFQHHAIARIIDYFPANLPTRKQGVIVFPQRETDLHHFLDRQRAALFFEPESRGWIEAAAGGPILRGQDQGVVRVWAMQIVQGLSELHQHCIIHRDLKPANILLKWDMACASSRGLSVQISDHRDRAFASSQGLSVEIADLGTAREMVGDGKRRRLSQKAEVDNRFMSLKRSREGMTPHCGTEPWMAPEVWFGGYADDRNAYGYPMDIWSYGAIVFELLTLQRFVTGSDVVMVSEAVRRLGPFPEKVKPLGPRQPVLLNAAHRRALSHADAVSSVVPLDVLEETGPPCLSWGHLRQTLSWLPEKRSYAKALQADAWLCSVGGRALRRWDSLKAPESSQDTAPVPESLQDTASVIESSQDAPLLSDAASETETPASSEAPASSQGIAPLLPEAEPLAPASSRGPNPAYLPARSFDLGRGTESRCVTVSETACACSGHCNAPGHRHRAGLGKQPCRNLILAPPSKTGSRYCSSCVCSMNHCNSPRNKSDFCWHHRKFLDALSWSAQAVRAAAHMLPAMVPGDVVAYVDVFPDIGKCLCTAVLAGWLKEPTAVLAMQAWLRVHRALAPPQGPISAEDVFRCLRYVLLRVDAADNRTEQQQLNRRGVARHLGVLVCARSLKLIGNNPASVGLADDDQHVQVRLGCQDKAAATYVTQVCPQVLRDLVDACTENEASFQNALASSQGTGQIESAKEAVHLSTEVRSILDDVGKRACLKWVSYARGNITRRILIAWLSQCLRDNAGRFLDWGAVTYEALEASGCVVDVNEAMAGLVSVQGDVSAGDASELLLGRRDQAVFVSMWLCLFHDVQLAVQDWTKHKKDLLLKSLRGQAAMDACQNFHVAHGVAPCPFTLLGLLGISVEERGHF